MEKSFIFSGSGVIVCAFKAVVQLQNIQANTNHLYTSQSGLIQ